MGPYGHRIATDDFVLQIQHFQHLARGTDVVGSGVYRPLKQDHSSAGQVGRQQMHPARVAENDRAAIQRDPHFPPHFRPGPHVRVTFARQVGQAQTAVRARRYVLWQGMARRYQWKTSQNNPCLCRAQRAMPLGVSSPANLANTRTVRLSAS